MLEKIGLPPKPSLRGNNWVADASHCQGCSSQFTFFNRKHHCRRCGGIFCNSCTLQRMVLRGQGDSPVRICEPCKKLEEAARFEMRHGHKNKAGRGGSKLTAKSEDEVLNQILGIEGKTLTSSRSASTGDMLSSDQHPASGASGSNLRGTPSQDDIGSISSDQPSDAAGVDVTPEELRQRAVEEKKKSRTLKAEGKREESLKAFKRGKELEREAATLELNLRKSRRKASSLGNNSKLSSTKTDAEASSLEKGPSSQRNIEKDDLTAELRELGWSDADFHDADKRSGTISLEGELSKLLGEVSNGAKTENVTRGIDKSQVTAHKRKALELKRQGKREEAMVELKKAKVLEKQIEEQELIGDAEDDSDEEFSALVRSLNFDKHEDSSVGFDLDQGLDLGNFGGLGEDFGGLGEDLGNDEDLEVTRDDLHDPDMLAALQAIGWTEETTHDEDLNIQFEDNNTRALESEIQSLKKEALRQKRAGNGEEALALLRKAKLLEKELDNGSHRTNLTDNFAVPSELSEVSMDQTDVDVGIIHGAKGTSRKPKSKSEIQRELLALKKRARALRSEGKFDEAEEELKKGKLLEKQLEELESAPKVVHSSYSNKQTGDFMITDDGDELVTDQDMNDPTYLSLLKGLGWSDDANENHPPSSSAGPLIGGSSTTQELKIQTDVTQKSKSDIKRELLGLKRKSLALRRQGETLAAEEMLKQAEVLEAQLAGLEALAQKEHPAKSIKQEKNNVLSPSTAVVDGPSNDLNATSSPLIDVKNAGSVTEDIQKEMVHSHEKQRVSEISSGKEIPSQHDVNSLEEDIKVHKLKALSLKRDGYLEAAREEFRKAKLLEKHLEENKPHEASSLDESESRANTSPSEVTGPAVSRVGKKDSSPSSAPKTLSSRDRFKLQQESLKHKRQALKLRREGRQEEADAETELAKALEAQLEESSSSSTNASQPVDEVAVEDFLDPHLLSALKAIGLDDPRTVSSVPEKPSRIDNPDEERVQLLEQIKAEKLKALRLKRAGQLEEARDALQTARLLEMKLNS
ncbi:OLC1v1021851C1 [Oldenlandia corymbosa var. corymbosa]|uniref:OLC1v1021851C1 n=1 Tax=Oldenlandia corymbosa var. corymbosa TaxID=529605 RepID=A0AAV1BXX5_OLDCO|nr:OLC1v1021851C1 [Oldenlandia corymbosa var. corymbosa]